MLSLFVILNSSLTPYYILPPFEKYLDSLNQNHYLSPLLSFRFGFCWNSFNSQLSYTLEDNLLLGSGGSPNRKCWDPWSETDSEWERPSVTGGVCGILLYWTLVPLKLLIILHRSLV